MKKEKTNNKINIKKIIIIIIILIAIFLTIYLVTNKNKTNNKSNIKYNTNEKVIEDKIVDNIKFTNIECTFDGNNSLLSYTITNIGKEKINIGEYEIIVKDKDGNILTNLVPDLDIDLEPNTPYESGNSVNIDISNAYSIEIKLN